MTPRWSSPPSGAVGFTVRGKPFPTAPSRRPGPSWIRRTPSLGSVLCALCSDPGQSESNHIISDGFRVKLCCSAYCASGSVRLYDNPVNPGRTHVCEILYGTCRALMILLLIVTERRTTGCSSHQLQRCSLERRIGRSAAQRLARLYKVRNCGDKQQKLFATAAAPSSSLRRRRLLSSLRVRLSSLPLNRLQRHRGWQRSSSHWHRRLQRHQQVRICEFPATEGDPDTAVADKPHPALCTLRLGLPGSLPAWCLRRNSVAHPESASSVNRAYINFRRRVIESVHHRSLYSKRNKSNRRQPLSSRVRTDETARLESDSKPIKWIGSSFDLRVGKSIYLQVSTSTSTSTSTSSAEPCEHSSSHIKVSYSLSF